MGGSLEMQPMDIPDVGRFALLQDPQGAHFFIMTAPSDA
jgi:predicted enzyme related to lactoylglutathione lyase